MRMHFDLALVRSLVEHSKAAPKHGPTYDQLYLGKYRHDGNDVKTKGGNFPEREDVDTAKIPPGLWLVGDQGVYLMSNGEPGQMKEETGPERVVAYAAEADPSDDDDWYDNKWTAFGGDDGMVFLEMPLVEAMLSLAVDGRACLFVSQNTIEVVAPAAPQATSPKREPRKSKSPVPSTRPY